MLADIVVIGSLNMDLVITAQRAPKAGETLPGDDFRTVPGGKGANQAVAASKAGGKVSMIGRVGSDDFGNELTETLVTYGVDTNHIFTKSDTATGVAMIVVEESGQNRILVVAGANGELAETDIASAHTLIQTAQMLVLQLEVPLATVSRALYLAHEAGVPTILNAAPVYPLSDDLLAMVTYLIVNESEAQSLSACSVVDIETGRQAAAELINRGVSTVILTLGSHGVLLANRRVTIHIPPYPVTPVDTTAAGDSFIGAFAVALAEGKSLIEAGHFGNAAGALAVTKAGAQPAIPYREEIEKLARPSVGEEKEVSMTVNSTKG